MSHRRSHGAEKPFNCTECGKSFGEKGILLRHTRKHAADREKAELAEQAQGEIFLSLLIILEVYDYLIFSKPSKIINYYAKPSWFSMNMIVFWLKRLL